MGWIRNPERYRSAWQVKSSVVMARPLDCLISVAPFNSLIEGGSRESNQIVYGIERFWSIVICLLVCFWWQ